MYLDYYYILKWVSQLFPVISFCLLLFTRHISIFKYKCATPRNLISEILALARGQFTHRAVFGAPRLHTPGNTSTQFPPQSLKAHNQSVVQVNFWVSAHFLFTVCLHSVLVYCSAVVFLPQLLFDGVATTSGFFFLAITKNKIPGFFLIIHSSHTYLTLLSTLIQEIVQSKAIDTAHHTIAV